MTLTLLVLAKTTGAEPPESIRYLMREPVTLWDWGLYLTKNTMEEDLQFYFSRAYEAYENPPSCTVTLQYEWEANQLEIFVFVSPLDFSRYDPRQLCRDSVKRVRTRFGIDPKAGEPFFGTSLLSTYFDHLGFDKPNKPEATDKTLDAITRIRVAVSKEGGTYYDQVQCKGPLVGTTDIYFSDPQKEAE